MLGRGAALRNSLRSLRSLRSDNRSESQHEARHAALPRPPHWGGYRLKPDRWEFWQGRKSRLHDRLRYRQEGEVWIRERLSP